MTDPTRPNEEDRLRLVGHRLLHELETTARERLIDRFRVDEFVAGRTLLEEGQSNCIRPTNCPL